MTRLPKIGRFILAQFDEEGVIVYQDLARRSSGLALVLRDRYYVVSGVLWFLKAHARE
jgi:hypothetical protein